nr:DExH-box ATP-dependent RNA helicase DExH12-like [Ipomoea batatas]
MALGGIPDHLLRICQNERILLPSIEPKVIPEDVCVMQERNPEEHPEFKMSHLGGGAEAHARFKQYEYRANSSLVLTTDSRPRDTHEPTGEPESLWGKIDPKGFGNRVFNGKPGWGAGLQRYPPPHDRHEPTSVGEASLDALVRADAESVVKEDQRYLSSSSSSELKGGRYSAANSTTRVSLVSPLHFLPSRHAEIPAINHSFTPLLSPSLEPSFRRSQEGLSKQQQRQGSTETSADRRHSPISDERCDQWRQPAPTGTTAETRLPASGDETPCGGELGGPATEAISLRATKMKLCFSSWLSGVNGGFGNAKGRSTEAGFPLSVRREQLTSVASLDDDLHVLFGSDKPRRTLGSSLAEEAAAAER